MPRLQVTMAAQWSGSTTRLAWQLSLIYRSGLVLKAHQDLSVWNRRFPSGSMSYSTQKCHAQQIQGNHGRILRTDSHVWNKSVRRLFIKGHLVQCVQVCHVVQCVRRQEHMRRAKCLLSTTCETNIFKTWPYWIKTHYFIISWDSINNHLVIIYHSNI